MPDLFSPHKNLILVPENFATADDFLSPTGKAKELGRQVDWVFTQRKTEYLAEILLLQNHKSVAIRRKVASGLGNLAGKEVLTQILSWQSAEADRQTWLILETLIDKLKRGLEQHLKKEVKVLSVTEALTYIKKLLGEGTYTIEGELSEVRPFRGMYYFALKDKQESRLNCWALEQISERINFPLNDGLSVRLTGQFKLSKDSRLYLETKYIELTGEGELLRNLKLLKEKLQNEGLFDSSRKRQILKIPQNILLIASPNSAALTDFTKVLSSRRSAVNIHFLPIKTQGVGAESTILEQLAKANKLTDKLEIDTIVITRGGGSQDDLFVFNSEKVVRSVHGLNRPTLVAIGHERDTTLAELAADLRCATPSQAAEKVSLANNEILSQVRFYFDYIFAQTSQKQKDYLTYTNRVLNVIEKQIQLKLEHVRAVLARTNQLASAVIAQTRLQAERQFDLSKLAVTTNLQLYRSQSESAWQKSLENVTNQVQLVQNQLTLLSSQIWLHDPQNILTKGYAIIWQEGTAKEKIAEIDMKKVIQIRMQDGEVETKLIQQNSADEL